MSTEVGVDWWVGCAAAWSLALRMHVTLVNAETVLSRRPSCMVAFVGIAPFAAVTKARLCLPLPIMNGNEWRMEVQ
jgi:hypothetical protein